MHIKLNFLSFLPVILAFLQDVLALKGILLLNRLSDLYTVIFCMIHVPLVANVGTAATNSVLCQMTKGKLCKATKAN